ADEQRVVLLAAAQHLNRAQHLALSADQRVDASALGLLVEVHAIGVERILGLFLVVALAACLLLLVDTAHVLGIGHPWALGDTVADVLHRIKPGHFLLLQEKGGVALAL